MKFHAIYWPAFLMAAELPLPNNIIVHSHWLVDHRKMSKSVNNVVDPKEVVDKVTVDGMRYFLLAEATPDNDSNYSETVQSHHCHFIRSLPLSHRPILCNSL